MATSLLIARSYLFVPGNRPERFDKACAAGADAVIIDLEDAVPPADKDDARAAIADWLSEDRNVLIRLNSADTEWFAADLSLCGKAGVAGIVLPKAERMEDIECLTTHGAKTVLPLIETASGFAHAGALSKVEGVQRLMFGSIDFQLDMGIDGEGEELLYFRSQLVLLSKLAGIQAPVDGVTVAIDDTAQLRADTLRARRLGFGGKLCIHPRQLTVVSEAFYPDVHEIVWAERVLEAASRANGAAVALDGKMVDLPVIRKAQDIAAEAARRKGLEPG